MAVSGLWTLFDVVLAGSVALVAFGALAARDHLEGIVLFITFGLLMAVTWVRLGAADIALAEAAIGAGLTGALFLNTLGELGGGEARRPSRRRRITRYVLCALVSLPVTAALLLAVTTLPSEETGLASLARAALPRSGVENPVTAVLLNYRAFDTLLELAVLLVALVGTWAAVVPPPEHRLTPPERLLVTALRLLLPGSVLVGGFLLWQGAHGPGGAFQAGALLAGAGVLYSLAEPLPERGFTELELRPLGAVGVLAFAGVGLWTLLRGHPLLTYRGDAAKWIILAVEVFATVSIAVALLTVFVAEPPRARRKP